MRLQQWHLSICTSACAGGTQRDGPRGPRQLPAAKRRSLDFCSRHLALISASQPLDKKPRQVGAAQTEAPTCAEIARVGLRAWLTLAALAAAFAATATPKDD